MILVRTGHPCSRVGHHSYRSPLTTPINRPPGYFPRGKGSTIYYSFAALLRPSFLLSFRALISHLRIFPLSCSRSSTLRLFDPNNHTHGGWLKLSPMDRHRGPALPTGVIGGDQLSSRPPGPTLETGEYPRRATSLGRLGHWNIPSTHAQISSSSVDRSHPSKGCRPHACSSTSMAFYTSRSISCRQRRI
jgi:hypothetical protein